jgi:hypothetical protein
MNTTSTPHRAQPARGLPAPHTLEPPMITVPLLALADAESLGVALALRGRDDAWTLYRLTSRADFKSRHHRRLLERVAFYWFGDHFDTAPLIDELMRVGSPLAPLAVRLSRLPGWLLDGVPSPEAIAAVIKYGPRAFRVPRLADRHSAAA